MNTLPRLSPRNALFLDFDGTLADIAPRPDAVEVAEGLVDTLRALQGRLGGALAIVSGRPIADIDHFLKPLRPTTAGEHGAARRVGESTWSLPPPPGLAEGIEAAQRLVDRYPALLLEKKSTSAALHYRQAPELEIACIAAMEEIAARFTGVAVQRGKLVVELRSSGADKGLAIEALLAQAPFAGRIPVFAGDDVTDESGFAVVQRLGGYGLKIGDGATLALHRCANPMALRNWLLSGLDPAASTPDSGNCT